MTNTSNMEELECFLSFVAKVEIKYGRNAEKLMGTKKWLVLTPTQGENLPKILGIINSFYSRPTKSYINDKSIYIRPSTTKHFFGRKIRNHSEINTEYVSILSKEKMGRSIHPNLKVELTTESYTPECSTTIADLTRQLRDRKRKRRDELIHQIAGVKMLLGEEQPPKKRARGGV